MSTKVAAPPERNYAQETRDNLNAQIDLSPKLLAAEQATRPAYTELDLTTLRDALQGTANAPGLVDLYAQISPRLQQIDTEGNTASRAADLADIKNLGPEAMAAMRAANPGQWALLDELTKQAGGDLAAGAKLTPGMEREIQQYVRRGAAARGMGVGPVDLYTEAMTMGSAGQNLLNQRRSFAAGVVDLNQRLAGDPFLQITGRSSGALSSAAGVTGQGQGLASSLGPDIFNPESQYGADIQVGNRQNWLAAQTATRANQSALYGAGISAAGSILGGFASRGK